MPIAPPATPPSPESWYRGGSQAWITDLIDAMPYANATTILKVLVAFDLKPHIYKQVWRT
jgi:hypothetical protein